MFLFVDDNWLALDGWIEILEGAGIEVHRISHADRALDFARANAAKIRCAILDVMMPAPHDWDVQGGKRTGLYLADRLRELNSSLSIIFLTAHRDSAVISELERYKGAKLVRKADVVAKDFAGLVQRLVRECDAELTKTGEPKSLQSTQLAQ